MASKKVKWYSPSLKGLLLSAIFYFFARQFLKGAEKQASRGSLKKKKK
jgi:hypothetical protein